MIVSVLENVAWSSDWVARKHIPVYKNCLGYADLLQQNLSIEQYEHNLKYFKFKGFSEQVTSWWSNM